MPLAAWLRSDPTLLRRAAHRVVDRSGRLVVDDDSVQDAATRAWRTGLEFESVDATVSWLSHEASATRSGRASRRRVPLSPGLRSPPRDPVDAIDAAAIGRVALQIAGARAAPMLAQMAGLTVLDDVGAAFEVTRERARQCRDDLASRVRKRFAAHPVMFRFCRDMS